MALKNLCLGDCKLTFQVEALTNITPRYQISDFKLNITLFTAMLATDELCYWPILKHADLEILIDSPILVNTSYD